MLSSKIVPFFASLVAAIASLPVDNTVTVDIPGLGIIKGQTNRTAPNGILGATRNFLSFTGIPYGSIKERFNPGIMRIPLTTDGEVFDATQPQVACWQVASPLVPGPFTEDCLTLNIYTPKIPSGSDALLPVIFFIHGGSFIRWSGNMFDGRRLLNKDVVVVTINYRVNIFGFLCAENDKAPGNAGLYDQVLALQWVNKFIKNFGGDPGRVTISGQSAGGASVTYLVDSPIAKGLFQGAISSSGNDLAGWANQNAVQPSPSAAVLRAATSVGCYNGTDNSQNADTALACLRSISPLALIQANNVFYSAPAIQTFNLTAYEKVTPITPLQSLNGLHNRVPLMIGANKNDGSFLLSRTYSSYLAPTGLISNTQYMKYQFIPDLLKSTSFGIADAPLGIHNNLANAYLGKNKFSGDWKSIAPGLVDIFSVFYFKAPAFETATFHSTYSPDTYLYSFDYLGTQTLYPYTGGVPQVPRGVTHCDELMYLFYFGDYDNVKDKLMSSTMINIWTNFATNLDPNGALSWPKWPKFTRDEGKYLRINAISSVDNDYIGSWATSLRK